MTYQHKYIATMTMTIVASTERGYKCLVVDTAAKGKAKSGKIQFFDKQDVKGDKAVWIAA